MSPPRRVVLDTNIVLSALLFGGGVAAQLRDAWQRGRYTPLVSTITAHELIRVLAYPKFRLGAPEREELLADYLPYATTVALPKTLPRVPKCRDPFDVPFLQLALAGNASALVTGDKDLLTLTNQFSAPILTPVNFLATLGDEPFPE
ncbi:MAG: putative toxin-antitoxin system toxin component, PIN family [Rudaea sp.]